MRILKQSIIFTILFIIICGVAYPLVTTTLGNIFFSNRANGSIIKVNGEKIGSSLIGQKFQDPRFFRGRVSAVDYNIHKESGNTDVTSGGSNLAPSNAQLMERVKTDIDEFEKNNPTVKREDIPTDLFTSSGSGLDPDISKESAKIQVDSISNSSGISKDRLNSIIDSNVEGRLLGILGEERVNVLKLNIEIFKILKSEGKI